MPLSYKELAAPVEFVTLAQAKLQCVVDTGMTVDDPLISGLIVAARRLCEKKMNRCILNRPMQLTIDYFPYPNFSSTVGGHRKFPFFSRYWEELAIHLPKPGCLAVTSITYLDQNGELQTLAPSTYTADINSEPARIFPTSLLYWPWCQNFMPGNVIVLWTAGTYALQIVDTLVVPLDAPFNVTLSQAAAIAAAITAGLVLYTGGLTLLDDDGNPVVFSNAASVLTVPGSYASQTLTATYYLANNIPQTIVQAMLLLISYWNNNRDAAAQNLPKAIEFAVDALLMGETFDTFSFGGE